MDINTIQQYTQVAIKNINKYIEHYQHGHSLPLSKTKKYIGKKLSTEDYCELYGILDKHGFVSWDVCGWHVTIFDVCEDSKETITVRSRLVVVTIPLNIFITYTKKWPETYRSFGSKTLTLILTLVHTWIFTQIWRSLWVE